MPGAPGLGFCGVCEQATPHCWSSVAELGPESRRNGTERVAGMGLLPRGIRASRQ
jgi:hypothetical protein